jgi:hypothetical protein
LEPVEQAMGGEMMLHSCGRDEVAIARGNRISSKASRSSTTPAFRRSCDAANA